MIRTTRNYHSYQNYDIRENLASGATGDAYDVTLGSSLISIAGAFNWCVNITNVTIPSTVRDISFAFVHCSSLTNVNLSEGITSIGAQAFWQCGNLKRIIIPDSVTNIGNATFSDSGLTSIFFEGNAPFVDMYAFFDDSTTAYYLSGSTGWGDFGSAAGISVQPWLPQAQIVQRYITVRTNLFGFNIYWASGQTVVIEACTNLVNPIWKPLQTNTLMTSTAYFSDPQWTNYSGRFYRLRSP